MGQPSSIIRWIAFAWLAYAVLWIFALTGGLASAIWAAPAFGLGLIAAFVATVVATARAFLYMRRSASTSRSLRRVAAWSAVGIVCQLFLMAATLMSIIPWF